MLKWLGRLGVAVLALLVLAAVAGALALRGSLPQLDGRSAAPGLSAAASIERDARGSATITGATAADVAYVLGFAHAQDRWFQMDLLRRASAGELSALLGSAMLDFDRDLRAHRFRAVARASLARATPEQRAVLEAYAAGANAGLASLGARPFEYFVLRATPEPWRAEDSLLAVLTMFVDLQGTDGHHEVQRGMIRDALPEAAAQFVYGPASEWDAALDGTQLPVVPPPAAEQYDLRQLGDLDFTPPDRRPRTRGPLGSNNWAVAGTRSATGTAIVANDMHLGLRVPNTWYHARLRQRSGDRTLVDATGPTLPGTPAIVTGSNGRVGWAFTNSYGDYADVIVLVPDPADPQRYLTAGGSKPFEYVTETIAVHDGEPTELRIALTQWGPVIGQDAQGRSLAYQWTAHDPAAVNLEMVSMASAGSLDEALAIAARGGVPAQNFVAGDASGRIAWTIAGQIPRRRGGDASVPRLSTDPTVGFDGWVEAVTRPRIVDPADGLIWTANARVVGGEMLGVIGNGGYDRGARAGQIAAGLRAAGERQTPKEQLALQLDDRALFLARWHALLTRLLDDAAVKDAPLRRELRDVLQRWSGHAAIDDPAYRLVRAFRDETQRRTFYALIAPARAAHPEFQFRTPGSFEGPLWQLIEQQPAHLLPPGYADWRAFLLGAADATVKGLAADCPKLAECTWGAYNTPRIRHPLSAALPPLARWLDMAALPLPGDNDLPRVQGRSFGASQRFAFAVGYEADGYYHMPAGQSGHPLSPFYRAGHDDWAAGQPAPFLPGPAEHTLALAP
jgi:penicillin G amidase